MSPSPSIENGRVESPVGNRSCKGKKKRERQRRSPSNLGCNQSLRDKISFSQKEY